MRYIYTMILLLLSWNVLPLQAYPGPLTPEEIIRHFHRVETLRISLLTVSPGTEVYERFGHTAIRLYNSAGDADIIAHYGVFDFDEPHFIYRFVCGETNYKMGVTNYQAFMNAQKSRGLSVREQVLDLDESQRLEVLMMLGENYLPENRTYRYSYLFNNCSTRPFRLIDMATGGTITYKENKIYNPTFRDMLKEKTGRNTWLDFGISLVVTGRADDRASLREQMFLPDYLSKAYAQATIAGKDSARTSRPLVKETRLLLAADPLVVESIEKNNLLTSPLFCCWTLLIVIVLLSVWQIALGADFYIIDTLLLLATGAAGVLVWFLSCFSEHPAVDGNWNCTWLLPTHLIFAFLIWIKKCKKAVDCYFFLNFAALLVYLFTADFTRQQENAAFIPLILILILRSYLLSPSLSARTRRKLYRSINGRNPKRR